MRTWIQTQTWRLKLKQYYCCFFSFFLEDSLKRFATVPLHISVQFLFLIPRNQKASAFGSLARLYLSHEATSRGESPFSLSYTHALKCPCQKRSRCIHTWHLLPDQTTTRRTVTLQMLIQRHEERKQPSVPRAESLSWCRLTRSKQSSVFLHRYVKHQGWCVRPYLLPVWRLHGNTLWRSHLVSVSRSQRERQRGDR